jgi:predicted metal-binding membrane protein
MIFLMVLLPELVGEPCSIGFDDASPMNSSTGHSGETEILRVGLHHGLYCIGCCWGLMIVLVALGVMNVAAMAALAAVIFLEKLWRRGPWLSPLVGVGFLAAAGLAPSQSWLLPALRTMPGMGHMSM